MKLSIVHCGLLSSLVGPYFTGGGMFYKANLVISLFFYTISGEKDEKIHDECSTNAETSFIRNSSVSMNSCEVIYSCGMMIKQFVDKETKQILGWI